MSENSLLYDQETGKLKRCCNMSNPPLAQCNGGNSSKHTGYFTIIDASEGDQKKVKVIDGTDPAGGNNVCYVNNIRFTVPPATFTVTDAMTIYIQYTPSSNGGTCALQAGVMPASVNNGNVYWEIGSVKVENGAVVIIQRHYGIVNMMWLGCKDVI